MNRERSLRVLVAENHPDLSEVMAQVIDAEPDMCCVGRVSSPDEVIPAARNCGAEVLILDLMLQGGSGMDLIEELLAALPRLRIVVFSGLASEELAAAVIQKGAAAFVKKGSDPKVLLEALRSGRGQRAQD